MLDRFDGLMRDGISKIPTEQLTPEAHDSGFWDASIRLISLILFGYSLKRGLVLRINKFFNDFH